MLSHCHSSGLYIYGREGLELSETGSDVVAPGSTHDKSTKSNSEGSSLDGMIYYFSNEYSGNMTEFRRRHPYFLNQFSCVLRIVVKGGTCAVWEKFVFSSIRFKPGKRR